MDTRNDVISSRLSSHFWVKMYVLQLLSGIKEKLDKMMQSNYLCVLLLVKGQKVLLFFFNCTVFTWFQVLEKMQDSDYVWWRHRPPEVPPRIKCTSSCREGQRLSTEGKIEIRGGSSNPPAPLYRGEGMTACRSEGSAGIEQRMERNLVPACVGREQLSSL